VHLLSFPLPTSRPSVAHSSEISSLSDREDRRFVPFHADLRSSAENLYQTSVFGWVVLFSRRGRRSSSDAFSLEPVFRAVSTRRFRTESRSVAMIKLTSTHDSLLASSLSFNTQTYPNTQHRNIEGHSRAISTQIMPSSPIEGAYDRLLAPPSTLSSSTAPPVSTTSTMTDSISYPPLPTPASTPTLPLAPAAVRSSFFS